MHFDFLKIFEVVRKIPLSWCVIGGIFCFIVLLLPSNYAEFLGIESWRESYRSELGGFTILFLVTSAVKVWQYFWGADSLKKAAPEIKNYLDDDRRISVNFGPNASVASAGAARMDMGLWEDLKREVICPNNEKIKQILSRPSLRLNEKEKPIVGKMLNHIDAFAAHCKNPDPDYSNHQFPLEFSDLIYKYCEAWGRRRNRITKYTKWLKGKIAEEDILVESITFFGSALYGQESADVDCLIKSEADSYDKIEKDAKKWESVKDGFQENFGFNLHLIVISKIETSAYDDFLSKLPAYQKEKI